MSSRAPVRLKTAHLRIFLAILVRDENLFKKYSRQLSASWFSLEHHRLLYQVTLQYVRQHSTLPSETELWAELESIFEEDETVLAEDERIALEDYFEFVFDENTYKDFPLHDPRTVSYANRVFQRLLVRETRMALRAELGNENLDTDLAFLLRAKATELELARMSQERQARTDTFPTGWDKRAARLTVTTGISFFDRYLGGGAVAGEVYGLMAPYGTCKTTLAVMFWANAAKQGYANFLEEAATQETSVQVPTETAISQPKRGIAVLVTYEAPLSNEIQRRVLIYTAQVKRARLDAMGTTGLSALSADPDSPLDYEKNLFKSQISHGVFAPERQRVEECVGWLNPHTLCLDFSGSDSARPAAGTGGVAEIVQRINEELMQREGNCYIRTVIIDYLGLMVDRDVTRGEGPNREETHVAYKRAVSELGKSIGKQFQCPVWVMHQFSGAANAKLAVTSKLHHTDAAGSKSFAENLDFAFVIGNLNADSVGQLACTKHRAAPKLPPTLIKVDGDFNNVVSPDNLHIDLNGNIVDKATASYAGMLGASAGIASVTLPNDDDTAQLFLPPGFDE